MRVFVLLPVLLAFLVGASPAHAWTWPVDGPVLQGFSFGGNPYAAGHHRGVDIGAPAGAAVVAPAPGTVSFAGTVPGGGRTVTIRTGDGYAVTLVHLGTIAVARNASVAEGETVGTIGPSGDAEHPVPYVHLGVRVASDPHGYVDPLSLLPPRPAPTTSDPPSEAPEPAQPEVPEAPVDATEAPPVDPEPAPELQPIAAVPADAPSTTPATEGSVVADPAADASPVAPAAAEAASAASAVTRAPDTTAQARVRGGRADMRVAGRGHGPRRTARETSTRRDTARAATAPLRAAGAAEAAAVRAETATAVAATSPARRVDRESDRGEERTRSLVLAMILVAAATAGAAGVGGLRSRSRARRHAAALATPLPTDVPGSSVPAASEPTCARRSHRAVRARARPRPTSAPLARAASRGTPRRERSRR